MTDCAVLHVTSLPGGGVDRHVRDIARGAPRRHFVWHAAEAADAIEILGERRILPLDREALAREPRVLERWLRSEGVGIVHAHSVADAPRERASWAAHALGVPRLLTLHDVLFLRREGFEPGASARADPPWLAQTAAFAREAAAVVAPSRFIAGLAREHIAGLEVAVIPNGSPPLPPPDRPAEARAAFAARRPRHVAAVLGSIGPHKGSAVLDALDGALAGSDIAIVVIGYLDAQVAPGWRGDHLYVHGAYDDDDVGALLRAYRAEVALFPNRVPESFSYALSDVWSAGVPVLVPAQGALGERVADHGGGWTMGPGASAGEIARALRGILVPAGNPELARVISQLRAADPDRVPTLESMTRSLDALYARFGIDAGVPLDARADEVQRLLATSLDGALFRQELVRLADELVQRRTGLEAERERARRFETESRAWIAKLEGDVAALQAELAREVEARRAFAEENAELRIHRQALESLPGLVRRLLLRKIRDARN
jgi:glycosyltransferase involved in cell wall biosynthesis